DLAVQIDVVGLLAGRDDLVGAVQELGERRHRSVELGLPERGGERDVDGALVAALGRPHLDVALADRADDADGQQLAREDPLDGLVLAGVEGDLDRVGVVGGVVEPRDQGDRGALRDQELQAQLGAGSGAATVHVRQTFSRPAPRWGTVAVSPAPTRPSAIYDAIIAGLFATGSPRGVQVRPLRSSVTVMSCGNQEFPDHVCAPSPMWRGSGGLAAARRSHPLCRGGFTFYAPLNERSRSVVRPRSHPVRSSGGAGCTSTPSDALEFSLFAPPEQAGSTRAISSVG